MMVPSITSLRKRHLGILPVGLDWGSNQKPLAKNKWKVTYLFKIVKRRGKKLHKGKKKKNTHQGHTKNLYISVGGVIKFL